VDVYNYLQTCTLKVRAAPGGVVQARDRPVTYRAVAVDTPVVPDTTDGGAASVNLSMLYRLGIAAIACTILINI
jgi:hypothetical protein